MLSMLVLLYLICKWSSLVPEHMIWFPFSKKFKIDQGGRGSKWLLRYTWHKFSKKIFININVFFKPLTVEEPTTFQTEVGFEPTIFASTNHFPSTFSIEPASSTFCTAQVALSSSLVSEGVATSDSNHFQDIFARLTKKFTSKVTIRVSEIWVILIRRSSQYCSVMMNNFKTKVRHLARMNQNFSTSIFHRKITAGKSYWTVYDPRRGVRI